MPSAASLALSVSPSTWIRRKRRLPVSGEVLVDVGDRVSMDETIARAMIPGPLLPVNAAGRLSLPPSEIKAALVVQEGEPVVKGQLLAESRSLFGLIKSELRSPIEGVIDAVSTVTGQITLRKKAIPLELPAYLPGEVLSIEKDKAVEIKGRVCQIQGIFGIGKETFGKLIPIKDDETPMAPPTGSMITEKHKDTVLYTKFRLTREILGAMIQHKVRAVVAPSASGADLMELTGRTLNPASTGDETLGLTIVLTEGFGNIAMSQRTFSVLSQLAGQQVSVSGKTQIRAGVIRPELIAAPLDTLVDKSQQKSNRITQNDKVRIIRGEAFGQMATVKEIPSELHTIGSGGRALVFKVTLENGTELTVPRPNVELIIS